MAWTGGNPRRGEPDPREYSISLEVTDPVKSGEKWDVTAVATLLYRRKYPPRPPREIVFFVNDEEIERVTTDEESGRVSSTMELPGLGSYIVYAFVADLPGLRAMKRVPIKEEKERPKKLAEPQVRAEGDAGEYLVGVLTRYEDGRPASGIRAHFLISPLGVAPRHEEKDTDEYGFALYELKFTEDECDVTVLVGGFEKKIENLQGPPRFPKPRPYQRPSDEELQTGSIWDVITRAWQRGREDAKGVQR